MQLITNSCYPPHNNIITPDKDIRYRSRNHFSKVHVSLFLVSLFLIILIYVCKSLVFAQYLRFAILKCTATIFHPDWCNLYYVRNCNSGSWVWQQAINIQNHSLLEIHTRKLVFICWRGRRACEYFPLAKS